MALSFRTNTRARESTPVQGDAWTIVFLLLTRIR